MNHHYGSPDPPHTLAGRLERLNDDLQALGERLKASIAAVVGDAISDAARDAVRSLLGSREVPADPYRDRHDYQAPSYYRDEGEDPWGEGNRGWEEEGVRPVRETPMREGAGRRWRNAVSGAVQAALWFLKRQPRHRPVLTTLAVTLAAGVAGFVAGPALAAGAGVLASVAGLLLTADASKSATELAVG